LRVLSLKYCLCIGYEAMEVIAEEANPFFLRELYLDGCEKITDLAISNLCGK